MDHTCTCAPQICNALGTCQHTFPDKTYASRIPTVLATHWPFCCVPGRGTNVRGTATPVTHVPWMVCMYKAFSASTQGSMRVIYVPRMVGVWVTCLPPLPVCARAVDGVALLPRLIRMCTCVSSIRTPCNTHANLARIRNLYTASF
jgi:hypothetical protein